MRFRAVPSPSGSTELALGAGPGRGAWLCRSHAAACLEEAQRRRAVERALRTKVRNDDIERLRAKLFACDSAGDRAAIEDVSGEGRSV